MATKNEVAAPEEPKNVPAVVAPGLPPAEMLGDLEALAGAGGETSARDIAIPFLYILQDLSPQVKKRDPKYVEGAEVGDIYNNVTNEVYKSIQAIPCYYEPAQVEWKANRGGFVAKHPDATPLVNQVKMVEVDQRMVPQLPNGNVLTETKYYYIFFRRDENHPWEVGLIGMSSTMIKCSREWQGLRKRTKLPSGAEAPFFSKVYNLGSKLVSKNNNDWFIWSIAQDRWVTSGELDQAKEFCAQAAAGNVNVNQSPEDDLAGGLGRPDDNAAEEVL